MANVTLCIITGSGINLNNILDKIIFVESFRKFFPGFQCSVKGHDYKVTWGYIGSLPIILCSGRIHAYEGYDWKSFQLFLDKFKKIGITHILSINAVGCLNEELNVPSYTVIEKIIPIPFMKFPLTEHLTPNWNFNLNLPKSTYIWVTGPSYETKSELKLFRRMGGDVIGMSGAPELFWALKLGFKTAMLSCVTNYCFKTSPTTHDEVIRNAQIATETFLPLLKKLILLNFNSSLVD